MNIILPVLYLNLHLNLEKGTSSVQKAEFQPLERDKHAKPFKEIYADTTEMGGGGTTKLAKQFCELSLSLPLEKGIN